MTLHGYVRWVIQQGWDALAMPVIERRSGPLYTVDVVHRDGPLQVERVQVPRGEITLHRHPRVESCEYFVQGEGQFRVNRRVFHLRADQPRAQQIVPVPSWAWHGGRIAEGGLVFLSIQRWQDGITVNSVLEDWEGPAEPVVL